MGIGDVGSSVSRVAFAGALIVAAMASVGCAAVHRTTFRADRFHIEVDVEPVDHRLAGRSVLDLVCQDQQRAPRDEPVSFKVLLHPGLQVTAIAARGAKISRWTKGGLVEKGEEAAFTPREYTVVLEQSVQTMTLIVTYDGIIAQDASAGEKPGGIHNFGMHAHIGPEGIYLAEGYWYPEPAADDTRPTLADFTLVAGPVPGFELVAGADPYPDLSYQTGRTAWRSPYPIPQLVLVGGPHEVHRREHNGVAINLHLKPDQAQHVAGLFQAVERILDRYEPLIGAYPARGFSIVDNFFSSGFAFPTFTLLSSVVIDMGERSQTAHGYIDHEMLHSWWGNGVSVDPADGNWCEALASYGANYYGHVLDGNEEESRRKRRNYSHFLSRLKPEQDKPLGTYGQEDGCGRGISYNKGAAVFHMLARKIGQDRFWAAMRRFTDEYVGKFASWNDIRRLCEEEGDLPLETFFRQWVRSGGAPMLTIEHARFDSAERTLTVGLSQGEPAFDLDVPVRVTHADGMVDVELPLNTDHEEITIPIDVLPLSVEVDPDYHIFRKVPADEIVPTTASTRYGDAFVSIVPGGEVAERYLSVRGVFERSFDEDERRALTTGEIEDGILAESCILILGSAVRDPYVSAFLSAIEFPVRWSEKGFRFDDAAYDDPGHAILCTVAHPGVPGGGVTVLYANSDAAIPPPMNVPFYDRSVIIFKDGRPIVRRDLEHRPVIPVDRS